ncbi:MAG: S41 family peptidase [Bacteroidales bacterium]
MKKLTLVVFIVFFVITTYCQNKESNLKFNNDFEVVENGIPVGWNFFNSNNYKIALDSVVVFSGKSSASLEFTGGDSTFISLGYVIPDNYNGRKIKLSGYIKTENVRGYAGLWMRIDPMIDFDNMYDRGVQGTTDWTKYEITLNMRPKETKQIVFGGLLVGKGKIWLDNLEITIDGKSIEKIKPPKIKMLPAKADKEFDKGSKIDFITAENNQIENLKTLGLIWGYLKYYHPNIAKGDYNWDYELFRILPAVMNAADKNDRDRILTAWIESFGSFPQRNEETKTDSEIKIQPDLDWIQNSEFSDELTTLLLKIKTAQRPDENYYIGLLPRVGNPDFKNEDMYASMKYPDTGFRILALFRYWNMIQYYFPYKNLIEEDWKNVLGEFIPRFIETKNDTDYVLTTMELIGRINDTHANIWGGHPALRKYFGMRYAAAELTFIEDKAVVTGFFGEKKGKETGLKIGDIISSVNDKPVEELVQEKLKQYPASNYPTKLRDIAPDLLRTNDTIIKVEYIRNNTKESTVLKTFTTKEAKVYSKYGNNDTCFKIINNEIAYINNESLQRAYLPKIWKSMKNTKGLVIDIRNYPSDFPIYSLSRYLMPERTPFVKITEGNIQNPGLFTFNKTLKAGRKNRNYYKGKVVILVNEISQSSAEFHTMAYRVHPNAIVIGSTTAGADGNVSKIYLPGGIFTMISGVGIYYPDGKETQRIGIVPDIEVKPTIQGIKEGKDELLEKAIEIILGQ